MALIEDELILSIALAPMHARLANCNPVVLTEAPVDGIGHEAGIQRPNTFAVLRNFKGE